MALWTPEYLQHTFWVDASSTDYFVFGSGSAVSTWKDYLRYARNNTNGFTQGTSSYRPTRVASVLNGEAVVRFDGVDNYLAASGNLLNTSAQASALAIFAVAENNGGDTERTIINISTNGSTTTERATLYFTSNTFVAGGRRLDTDSYQYVEASTNSDPKLVAGLFDYTNAQLFVGVDGVYTERVGGFQTAGISGNGAARIALGGRSNTTAKLNGDIAEVLVLRYIPTEAERLKIEGYLAHKYGLEGNLALGHLYKTNPPEIELTWTLIADEAFDYPDGTNIIGQSIATDLGNIEWQDHYIDATWEFPVISNELHPYVDAGVGYWDATIRVAFGSALTISDYTQGTPPPLVYVYDYNGNGFYANGPFKIEVDVYFPTDIFSMPYQLFDFNVEETDSFTKYKNYCLYKSFNQTNFQVGLNTLEMTCLFAESSPEWINFYLSSYIEPPNVESDLPVIQGIRVYSANDFTVDPMEYYTLQQRIGAHLLSSKIWDKPTDYEFVLFDSLDPVTEVTATGYARLLLTPSDTAWSGPTSGNGEFSNLKTLQFRPMNVTLVGWGLVNPNDGTFLLTRAFAAPIVCTTDLPGPYFPIDSLTFKIL